MGITSRRGFWLMAGGLLLAVGSLFGLYLGDRPLWGGEALAIEVGGDETLAGTYHEGWLDAGVLLLSGFGSDQVTMRSAASEYARNGWHVLTFDFAGHNRSPGGLGFDNAETDRLARQTLAAKSLLLDRAGLTSDQLVFLGHSLGARVALQAATLDSAPPAGLVLLGAQVNLATNVQAEFFTGVSDADLGWVAGLGPNNPTSAVLLSSGSLDDILTVAAATLLHEKLGDDGTGRQLSILPGLLHNYEVFSPATLGEGLVWSGEVVGVAMPGSTAFAGPRIALWLTTLVGLFTGLAGGWQFADASLPAQPVVATVAVTRIPRFLLAKTLLWLVGLVPSVLLTGLLFFVPLGKPVFNLIYGGFIGGYGLLMLGLYRGGWMPASEGRLLLRSTVPEGVPGFGIAAAVGVALLMIVLTTAFARSGWFWPFPLNQRALWLLLMTPITALGFWVGLKEIEMLIAAKPASALPYWLIVIIGLLPFILQMVFLGALGSLSGMIGALEGLLALALAILTGAIVYRLSYRPWFTAVLQAIILYWLVLPRGVLFE